jgi:uncharacterized membrane protein (DUF4010 family)
MNRTAYNFAHDVALPNGTLVAVVVLTAAMNARSIVADRSLEITTSAALLVTYVLGVLVGLGGPRDNS